MIDSTLQEKIGEQQPSAGANPVITNAIKTPVS